MPVAKPIDTIIKPPQVPPKDFGGEIIGGGTGGKPVQDLGPLPPGGQ